MAALWYYTQNGQRVDAPISEDRLKNLISSGHVQPTDLVWTNGMQDWAPAGNVTELFAIQTIAPAETPRQSPFDEVEGYQAPTMRRRQRPYRKQGGLLPTLGSILGVVFVIGMIAVGVYFGMRNSDSKRQVLKFNESVVSNLESLAQLNKQFDSQTVEAFKQFRQPNVIGAKGTYKQIESTIKSAQQEAKSMTVPSKPSAKAFFASYKRFLDLYEKELPQLKRIIKIAENPWYHQQDKQNKIATIIDEISRQEQDAMFDVQSTQRQFASDYNIKLKFN